MVRAAQFHAPNPSLDVRVVDAFHLCVDDPVAEIFLAVVAKVLAARFHLADQDRGRLQIADPLEQLKEVFPGVFEPRHDFEDRERIDDEDIVVEGFRFSAYILKISSHVRSAMSSRLERIMPRSTMLSCSRYPAGSGSSGPGGA